MDIATTCVGIRENRMRTKFFKLLVFTVMTFTIIGCEMQADLKNTVEYRDSDISFTLPGNWNITKNVDNGGVRYLIIETSGEAILTLNIFPIEGSRPLKEFMENMVADMTNNFPFGKRNKGAIIEVETVVDGRIFKGYENQFIVTLLGVEVPHLSYFYYQESDSRVAYLSAQVVLEDIDKVQEGFELTLSSLKLQ